jgi:hypothetical protein
LSELTWARLSLLDTKAIDNAASYWSSYIDQLTEAASAIEEDVPRIIDERSFGEQIGDDCRSQLQAIASEIHDHIDEAASRIKAVLDDAHEDLSTCQTRMQDLIDEVLDAKLRIREGGIVHLFDGMVYLSDARLAEIRAWAQRQADADESLDADDLARAEIERVEESECRPLTERIRELVETARGYDDGFTARLNDIRDAYVEMPPPLGSDWHEDVAEYWSNRAVDLLGGGEDGVLSAEELDEFNEIVAERADSPVFATALMNELGPVGLTTHLADVVWNVYDNDPGNDTFTADQVNELYAALGVAMATATDPTNQVHVDDQWIAQLMNLGGSEITTSDGNWRVNGYELLAPALPHGQYHEDFLVPVTEHMIAIDAAGNWNNGPPLAGIAATIPDVDYGTNPVNWALAAIDNNPRAALNLFAGGGTGLEDIDGVNLGDVRPVEDPFEYLMGRAGEYGVQTSTISPNLLGNALESATTGVSTNPAYAPDTPPIHTDRMASLADRLIDHVSANPAEFTDGPKSQMIDNFGAITVAYIDDFHQAMGSDGTEDWAIDQPGADLSLGSPGNDALASDWLRIIGHDQAATAEVWGASEGLMYNQLESALAYDDQGLGNANQAFEMHGGVTAALTVGSLDAIADGVYQEAADHNAVVELFAEGAKFGAGVGTGIATGNPFAGAAADQVAGYGIDYVTDYFKITDEEARAKIAELAQQRVELNEDTMLSDETVRHVEQILRTDPNLSEHNIQTALHDYYDRYWTSVKYYAEGLTG